MKYYRHHIGDFDRATRHLTRIERSVYRDLIELYYDTEQQLTLDVAALCRLILARSNEESTAVEQSLNEFFTKTPDGWYHGRCEAEIADYHARVGQRASAGKASAKAKADRKANAIKGHSNSTSVERALNESATKSQLTNNQEPITKNQEDQELLQDTPATPSQSESSIAEPKKANGQDKLCALVIAAYHEALPKCRKVSAMTPKRHKRIITADKLARRIVEQHGQDYDPHVFWPGFFAQCATDPWMRGEVRNPKNPAWRQNLDVLLAEDRFAAVIDSALEVQNA